jgi:hypothetical protein
MLWQGAKWRILKNFKLQNEECHNYGVAKLESSQGFVKFQICQGFCQIWV